MRALQSLLFITIFPGLIASPDPVSALTPPLPPIAGDYRVQPGSVVLACGGIIGQCQPLTLEGTIRFDSSFVEARIEQSDLRLRGDHGAWAFPGTGDLPLVGLGGPIADFGESTVVELAAEGLNGQRVALELVLVGIVPNLIGNYRLALRGTYDEGCCDRFVYDFGNVRLEPDFYDGLALGTQEDPRFVVDVRWSIGDGTDSFATAERLGSTLGYFWFYSPENPEIFVKLVSACDTPYARIWFFASGLTNLGVLIDVTDRFTGQTKTYINPVGTPFAPIQDTGGFPCVLP